MMIEILKWWWLKFLMMEKRLIQKSLKKLSYVDRYLIVTTFLLFSSMWKLHLKEFFFLTAIRRQRKNDSWWIRKLPDECWRRQIWSCSAVLFNLFLSQDTFFSLKKSWGTPPAKTVKKTKLTLCLYWQYKVVLIEVSVNSQLRICRPHPQKWSNLYDRCA